jgi:crotonobetainyl-CoA:carnitine CoA-transferase CaiB-like acyl-CoA transferase
MHLRCPPPWNAGALQAGELLIISQAENQAFSAVSSAVLSRSSPRGSTSLPLSIIECPLFDWSIVFDGSPCAQFAQLRKAVHPHEKKEDARGLEEGRDRRDVTEPAGPLQGLRVLDLSWGVAGPVGVLLLAELGADVIKIEPPGGDPFRRQPAYYVWNRSRRSVVLDLKAGEGRDVFLRLCQEADVLVETFSPGTMDRLGLSYADVSPRCPRLVFCSVPAYPPGHRFADRPGWDATVQARSGMQSEQPGWRPGPVYLHFPAPSMAACFLLASGVLSALLHREATGRGQHVQTSLYQGVLAYTTQIWQEHERAPAGFHKTMAKTYPPGIHQTSLFECAGGEWIHAATVNGLTPTRTPEEILGLDPVDPRALYADPALRARHDERLRAAYARRSRQELIEEFHAAGLGAEAVAPMADVFSHPQFIANRLVATVDDPELGLTSQVGVPAVLRRTPGAVRGGQPPTGAHSREVLAEAGYFTADIDRLLDAGIVEDPSWAR